jgi:large subunit ribosomal protein L14
MIQVQSWLKTMDNCGARYVECIKTFGGFNRQFSFPGDFILVSVKQLRLIRKVRVGQVHLAVITRSRKETRYLDGTSSRAQNNVVLVLNKKKRVIGTRVFGWVSRKLRRKKFLRILVACGRRLI